MIKVEAQPFNKKINVPTSKSYANRMLVLAALEKNGATLEGMSASTDVIAMLKAFEKIGIKVSKLGEEKYFIKGPFPQCEMESSEAVYLETGDGGTTNRFIMPMLARGKNRYRLKATLGMKSRPMEELESTLTTLGAMIKKGEAQDDFWYEIKGPMQKVGKKISIDSSRSTQFASGLMLSLADMDVDVEAHSLEASESYFLLTKDLVKKFRSGNLNYHIPVDFSSLSYPLALALVSGSAQIANCFERDLFQADSAFLPLLTKLGAPVSFAKSGLEMKGLKKFSNFEFDCGPCPDLTPTLAFVAAHADGASVLKNLAVLHYKESDRVAEIIKILEAFGVEHAYDSKKEELVIHGRKNLLKKAEITPPPDHRMIMMAYLFMRANQGGILHETHHVAKSFPDFFSIMA